MSQIQAVHRNPSFVNSRRQYLHIISSYLRDDVRPQLKDLPTLDSRDPSICDIPGATQAETSHHLLAQDALVYLRSRNIHFRYTHCSTTYLEPSSAPTLSIQASPFTLSHTHIQFPDRYLVQTRSNLLLDGISNATHNVDRASQLIRWMKAYAILGACYAGLHLAAWNFDFATEGERWAWRASGIVMLIAPKASVIGVFGFWMQGRILDIRRKKQAVWSNEANAGTPEQWWLKMKRAVGKEFQLSLFRCGNGIAMVLAFVGVFVALIAWVGYPFARIYVLGESFAALRSVEKEVYRTVEWTGFIPHVG